MEISVLRKFTQDLRLSRHLWTR